MALTSRILATGLIGVVLLFASGCQKEELPVYSSVGPFTLTNQQNEPFTREDLTGRVWIADFIFTNCAGPCKRMSRTMSNLAQELKDTPEVGFLSFSVDPARDTPQVLAEYALHQRADDRWVFLTGDPQTLHRIKRQDMLLGDVDGSLNHSTRFVLIDRQANIRGFYATADEGVTERLAADSRSLARSGA